MPPADSGKSLKPEQINLLRRWIEGGAAYQKHWAFEPPAKPALPAVSATNWPGNEIDHFILAAQEAKGLNPNPRASKEKLLRRVTLDLTGLPPKLEDLDRFLADNSPQAYETAVERLLASPEYGEHMARYWLDVARYGDTHGLHLDNERSMWPYRDWVVKAFNDNLPYDKFTVWQLAGDLLPNPTTEQLVASGFNRCNPSTSEGGAIDEEFQVRYAVDRVETTSSAWLGLTMGCAVCHDHKLDPITQKEFYQVFSLFNNIAENAMDGNALLPPPTIPLPSAEQEKELAALEARLKSLRDKAGKLAKAYAYTDSALSSNTAARVPLETVVVEDDFPPDANVTTDSEGAPVEWVTRENGPVFSGDKAVKRSGPARHQTYFTKYNGSITVRPEETLFLHVYLDPTNSPKALMLQVHTDEWKHRANWGEQDIIQFGPGKLEKVQIGNLPKTGEWVRLEVKAGKLGLPRDAVVTGLALTQFGGTAYWDKIGVTGLRDPAKDPVLSFAAWVKSEKKPKSKLAPELKTLVSKPAAERNEAENARLLEHFLVEVYAETNTPFVAVREQMASVRKQREALEKDLPHTMISKELETPRPTHVLLRGEYDKKGEAVGPGVPAVLPPLPPGQTTNRLIFANWLVSTNHPLTARVTVNRFWQQFFGTGLVKTSEDFGARAEWPSHPELLDWLATEFMSSGWDVKKLVHLIVLSSTYQQDSKVTPKALQADPENRYVSRGPRHRLDAEVLRDYALEVSGLLNRTRGGRGVRTYQPPGIWEAVGYTTSNTAKYSQDKGDALYRRSLYLFWKRTAPPPSMTTFDAPSREQCRVRRERTNTPLQALLTMNDIQYFEAARQLAARMWREGGGSDSERLKRGFRLVTSRHPDAAEQDTLEEALTAQRTRFSSHPDAAAKVLSVGESPAPKDLPQTELAAYTLVANLLLNLDEAVTKN